MFSPLEQFEIGILYTIWVDTFSFLEIVDISFTNLSLFLFITFFVYYVIKSWVFAYDGEKVLGNPIQYFMELLVSFIINLLKNNLTWSDVVYFGLLYTIFIFVLFSNIIGVFPYTFTVTGHLAITFGVAFCVFLGLNIIGYRIHTSFLLTLLLPSGVPFSISSLLILIEFISYNFRVISLSVRLFANIMAGHTLLAVIFSFNHFLVTIKASYIVMLLLPLVLLPCIILIIMLMVLEFGVAVIQAYVFTLLCTMYLYDAKYLH
jgi:F-type H+-transporting ATPase subunit a